MVIRIIAPAFLALIWNGRVAAQSPNVRPQIQITGESNGTLQSQEETQKPDKSELIAQFESQLQTNPDDVLARTALAGLYSQAGQNDKSLEQSIWLVQHHPESAIIPPGILGGPEGKFAAANYQQLKIAWEGALADHPRDSRVLYCGGLFFKGAEPERALELFNHARQLEPSKPAYLEAVAHMYEEALLSDRPYHKFNPSFEELMARLRTELSSSTDAALLSRVGSRLTQVGPRSPDNPNWQLGLRFMEHATVLEPDNPLWKRALEIAKNPLPAPPTSLVPPGAVRIGSDVAEANLVQKAEPVYPPLAKSARVSGNVEFAAVIGTNGHIQNLQLVRGHPLLVRAAREAVLQYVYKPTLLNGNPAPVMTSIVIPFELPPQ